MAEEIITKYIADVSQMRAQLTALEGSVASLDKKLIDSGKKATAGFNQQAGALGNLKQTAISVGAAFGIAFGAAGLLALGQRAVKSFLEAEESLRKVEFAAKAIAKASNEATDALIKQSDALQGLFSDEQIQSAQTALLTIGLTADEVKKFIPILLDAAAASGDFEGTIQKVVGGINGQTRGLKSLGVVIDGGADKQKNFNDITQQLIKFQGSMQGALSTTGGQVAKATNNFNEFLESLGGALIGAIQGAGSAFDLLTGNAFDLITTSDELPDTFEQTSLQAIRLADSIDELDLETTTYLLTNRELNESLTDTFNRLKANQQAIAEFTAIVSDPKFRIAILEGRKDLTGSEIVELERLKRAVIDNANAEVETNKKKNILNLENLKAQLESAKQLLETQEIGSDAFNKTRDIILAIEKQISDATGKNIENDLKKRQEAADKLAALYNELADIRISLIQDEQERAIAGVEQELAARLEKITGTSKVENDLRVALRLKAEQEIEKINEEFIQKDLEAKLASLELQRQLAIHNAEFNGHDTLEIQKDFLRQRLELELQNTELTGEQRLALIAKTEDEISDLSIQRLHEDAERYNEIEEEKTRKTQEEEDKRQLIREQAQEVVVSLLETAIELSEAFNNANFENDIERLEIREQSELDALQSLLDQKLISEEDFNARKTGLDEKYQAQRLELEREAARKEKLQKAFSIAITTAENVIKVLGVPPVPNFLLAALAAAQGLAAEIAVAARPLPFAKGAKRITGGQRGVDSVHGILMPNEMVVPEPTVMRYAPALDAIFDHDVSPRLMNAVADMATGRRGGSFAGNVAAGAIIAQEIGMDYGKMGKAVQRGTDEMTDLLYSIDKKMGDGQKSKMFDRRKIS